jgi:uncharacterized SAM-binding protein YcdF (DUF218 family)
MFFILSKVLGFFVLPSNVMLAAGLIGLLLICTKRVARAGRRLVTASMLLFLACGLLPAGKLLMTPLEERFPPWDEARGAPDGIIVLGGAIDPEFTLRPYSGLTEAAERITVIAELARRYPAAKILYTGGDGHLTPRGDNEARTAASLFRSFGVPDSRIMLEAESRTTAENATFSAQLVKPKPGERWMLITSAFHMPRSVGAFRKAGFDAEAFPVDYRTNGFSDLWSPFSSVTSGLEYTDRAMREWVGLAAYWLTGRSSALFPAP